MSSVHPPVCLLLMMTPPLFLLLNMRTQEQGGPTHSPSTNTPAGRVPPSPCTPFLGVGKVNDRFDLSMYPRLSQASQPPE